ncbi:MAG: hypothetical protein C0501_31640 [Isosphaera sp.]|nr:hypothetical protein [Isosphaera sp.]
MVRHLLLAAVVGLAGSGSAKAVFFTSQAAFATANPGLPVLDFEGIAGPNQVVQPAPNFAAQGVTFAGVVGGPGVVAVAGPNVIGTPSAFLAVNAFDQALDINFLGAGVGAAGFNVAIGFQPPTRSATVEVFSGATLLDTQVFPTADENVFTTFAGFSGFASNITRIRVTPSTGGFVLIDNLAFGAAAVPEPASAALLGLGAVGLVGARLRRKRTA